MLKKKLKKSALENKEREEKQKNRNARKDKKMGPKEIKSSRILDTSQRVKVRLAVLGPG